MRRGRGILDLDWLTVLLYLSLVSMGWLSIYAVGYGGEETQIFDFSTNHGKQMVWIGISLFLALLILLIDSKFYITFAYVFYGLSILSLIALLVFGSTIKGSTSWFVIGGFSIQPAEFAKFTTSLALAKFLSTLGVSIKQLRGKLVTSLILGLPAVLILMQNDLGSTIVFAAFIWVLYREGLHSAFMIFLLSIVILSILGLLFNKFILLTLLLIITVFVLYFNRRNKQLIYFLGLAYILCTGYIFTLDYIFNNVLKDRHRDRINLLLGKDFDPQGSGYNVNQSMIAIGSGGFSGKGYLEGTQTKYNFVPEQSTDFIFCTVGEEHGFIGSAFVIIVFFLLLFRIIYIAERQRSAFTRIYGYGVASILFFHVNVNIGMTIGLAPVVGIPLPFFSYGGSSILAFTILLFILLKLDSDRLAVLR